MVEISEIGSGRPIFLLHGGGGPLTVASIGGHLSQSARVIAPTHPGFNGTESDPSIHNIRDLANVYSEYLNDEDLDDVVVVGSSVGGWIAAELALGASADRIAGIVLINATGIEVEDHPILNISRMLPQEFSQFSFHDPSNLRMPPPSPEGLAIAKRNAATLASLAGEPYMYDPSLLSRLSEIKLPSLVIWGESDRVVDFEYGRRFASAIPGSTFVAIPNAGHLPHLENAEPVFEALDAFASAQHRKRVN
jgi:pimeloyl-ACP methyl ester carboxylesterase